MNFVAEDTVRALDRIATEPLTYYRAALHVACSTAPPPFGQLWYGDKYRFLAVEPTWLAASLIANAEKEGDGSRKLWALAGRASEPRVAEAIRQHAIDESRHALIYVAMCQLVFPEALDVQLLAHARALSPQYRSHDVPPVSGKASRESVLDELVQMNLGEIRTRIHQLLLQPVLRVHCPPGKQERLSRTLDVLLTDETRHIQYTARLIEAEAQRGKSQLICSIMRTRLQEFNQITLAEVGDSRFVGK